MGSFWAKFKNFGGDTFRLDTRIYLDNIDSVSDADKCLGAVVGKNPGSAKPSANSDSFQQINLDGDKLLPTVKNIISKSYEKAGIQVPINGYIQILNLFYLCNPKLDKAIAAMENNSSGPRCCESESKYFPWAWYVWGRPSEKLDPYKIRFSLLNTPNHFFYDNNGCEVVSRCPAISETARHTQGLKHELIVPYIAEIVKNCSSEKSSITSDLGAQGLHP
jgi:hypothetical protein